MEPASNALDQLSARALKCVLKGAGTARRGRVRDEASPSAVFPAYMTGYAIAIAAGLDLDYY